MIVIHQQEEMQNMLAGVVAQKCWCIGAIDDKHRWKTIIALTKYSARWQSAFCHIAVFRRLDVQLLRCFFTYTFKLLQLETLFALIAWSNFKSLELALHLGFMIDYEEAGKYHLVALTPEDCKYLDNIEVTTQEKIV